jgi:molecular chaperone Hsp33
VAIVTPTSGELRRFILEHQPVRGFWVQLGEAWRELHRYQEHPPAVEALLGEAVTATLLLAATLKFHGTLTLQLNGGAGVSLLVAQCTHDYRVRAVARSSGRIEPAAGFQELVGAGRLSVTIEAERAMRYQGIVALEGASLAECLESYFARSEQLPTRLALSADGHRTGGILLQKLPSQAGEAVAAVSQQAWEDLQQGLASIGPADLRAGAAEEVLLRLCGEHDCRLFGVTPVQFSCRCDESRVAGLLRALGAEDMRALLQEQGAVSVTCEFCGRPYRFDAVDIERLFAGAAAPQAPQTLN